MNMETGNLMYAMVVILQHNVDFDGLACTDQFLVKKKRQGLLSKIKPLVCDRLVTDLFLWFS